MLFNTGETFQLLRRVRTQCNGDPRSAARLPDAWTNFQFASTEYADQCSLSGIRPNWENLMLYPMESSCTCVYTYSAVDMIMIPRDTAVQFVGQASDGS